MKKVNLWKAATIILAVVLVVNVILFALPAKKETAGQNGKNGEIALIKPPFLSNVSAATSPGPNFLYQEAGISAYTNVGQTIDIGAIKSVFRTVEQQTSDYIVGTVALPDHPVSDDVHVYVDKNGWVVAYYFKDKPASAILEWNSGAISRINLETAIDIIVKTVGTYTANKYYYDFSYPDANKLTIIVGGSSDYSSSSFKLKIPSSFKIYEYSYSFYSPSYSRSFYVDNNEIIDSKWGIYFGTLSSTQLAPDAFHTISLSGGYAAIVLVYKE
jgi:hypothetical protein